MAYTLTVEKKPGHLRICVNGFINAETGPPVAQAVRDATVTHGCNRVLCDLRSARLNLGTMELYWLGESVADIHEGSSNRAAILVQAQDLRPDRPFETAANDHGIQLKVFADEETAVHWLCDRASD